MHNAIVYKFQLDGAYFRVLIQRYYSQRPFLFKLPVQFALLAVIIDLVFLWNTRFPIEEALAFSLLLGALIVLVGVTLTKIAILQRFKARVDFGTEVAVAISDTGLSAQGNNAEGHWAWSAYPRSVRFTDGLLLLRAGVIRWLPDAALHIGDAREATQLVQSKTRLRQLGQPLATPTHIATKDP